MHEKETDWVISSEAPNRRTFNDHPKWSRVIPEVVGSCQYDGMKIWSKLYRNIKITDYANYARRSVLGEFKHLEDLTGMTFGRLHVMYRADDYVQPNGKHKPKWHCKCECGKEKDYLASNLKRGTSKSCGCLQREKLSNRKKIHGGWANKERLYQTWCKMKARCFNDTDMHFHDYGGRGITVCDEWVDDYSIFRKWAMENGYQDNLSIDRIDVNGNYTPDNCRWVDNKTQQNNRRSCKYITYNGETHTVKEWSQIRGIPYGTLMQRYNNGWNIERMLNPHKKPTD